MKAPEIGLFADIRWCGGFAGPQALTVPDPFRPTCTAAESGMEGWGAHRCPTRLGQRQRRAKILAEARRLLSERGFDGLLIQELADISGISKQTVYNLVGDKHRVIVDAINDHVFAMVDVAARNAVSRSLAFNLVDLFCFNFLSYPDYTRNASLCLFLHDRSLCREVKLKQAQLWKAWLLRQRTKGLLRDRVEIGLLAEQLAALNEASMVDWASGTCTIDDLRRSMVTAHGIMLLGAMCHAEAQTIEAWMQAAA